MDWLSWKYYQRSRVGSGFCPAKCQSLKATIHYATFSAATVCSNWKLHAPYVWAHTHYTIHTANLPTINFSHSRGLFGPPFGILCINQSQKLLSSWWGVLIYRSYFSDTKSRMLLSSFMQLGREYLAYWIPCLAAAIDHFRKLLPAANDCYKNLQENFRSLLWL